MFDGPEWESPESTAGNGAPPPEDGWIEVTPARRPPPSAAEQRAMRASQRSFPTWAILLVPALLAAGWAIGKFSASSHRPAPRNDARAASTRSAETIDPVAAVEMPPRAIEHPDPGTLDAKLGKPSHWMTSISAAEEESRRTGKPVLIEFDATWSPQGRAMRAELFADPTRGVLVQRLVVPVSIIDRSRDTGANAPENEELMQSYSIEAFPTLVIYKPGGGHTLRTTGFAGADATLDWIRNAANAAR